jgi:hypothetical protein
MEMMDGTTYSHSPAAPANVLLRGSTAASDGSPFPRGGGSLRAPAANNGNGNGGGATNKNPLLGGAYDYAGGGAAPPPHPPPPSGNVVSPHNHHHQLPTNCLNPAADVNSRLDTQVEVRVYPCNNNNNNGAAAHLQKKKFTQFHVKPEGVIIQGTNRRSAAQGGGGMGAVDLGAEYAAHVGRRLQRYELSDTRACQLLVTTHGKSFWVVPAPEAFSRHSGTCRLLGDRKHPAASHGLQVGDFLRVGSVGVVVIETHDGRENRVLSEEKIQKIMKDTTNNSGGFDLADTDGGE